MNAKWKHDCGKCKYIATVFNGNDTLDWYTCGQGGLGKTVLARFDDEDPSHYWSMPVDVLKQMDGKFVGSKDGSEGYSAMHLLAETILTMEKQT
jgi:hypothetical protein